jgi:putative addiction module killer protein
MELGLAGDVKPVRQGVSELRIPYGPGYRVYFMRTGLGEILLLAGGTKRGQRADVRRAVMMARSLKEDADD